MHTHCEPKIRLYVVSHKEAWIPEAECLIPFRADCAEGIHISDKENYCELRAQYWVWQNENFSDKDYVGFFHYRRYLELSAAKGISCAVQGKRPLPYRIRRRPEVEKYKLSEVWRTVCGVDVIAPIWEYTGLTVWERYEKTGHRQEDLKLIYQIIKEKYLEYLPAADIYLNRKGEYYGNIYIMRWPLFCDYCCWLFDILNEYDIRAAAPPARIDGHLGERLFGIYFTWLLSKKGIACREYPRIHFSCYDDEKHIFLKRRLVNMILPPGSKRRKCVIEKVRTRGSML